MYQHGQQRRITEEEIEIYQRTELMDIERQTDMDRDSVTTYGPVRDLPERSSDGTWVKQDGAVRPKWRHI